MGQRISIENSYSSLLSHFRTNKLQIFAIFFPNSSLVTTACPTTTVREFAVRGNLPSSSGLRSNNFRKVFIWGCMSIGPVLLCFDIRRGWGPFFQPCSSRCPALRRVRRERIILFLIDKKGNINKGAYLRRYVYTDLTFICQSPRCLIHKHTISVRADGRHSSHCLLWPPFAKVGLFPTHNIGVVSTLRFVAEILWETALASHSNIANL